MTGDNNPKLKAVEIHEGCFDGETITRYFLDEIRADGTEAGSYCADTYAEIYQRAALYGLPIRDNAGIRDTNNVDIHLVITPIVTSMEIAEDLGKDHDEIASDIREMLDNGKLPKPIPAKEGGPRRWFMSVVMDALCAHFDKRPGRSKQFEETFTNSFTGVSRVEYRLPKKEAMALLAGYQVMPSDRVDERFEVGVVEKAMRAATPPEDRRTTSRVYFIQSSHGSIKIGHARKPASRLRDLQVGHAEPLTLLATTEGGQKAEAQYHKRFATHRLKGEWFSPHPDILAEIERLNADVGAPA